MAGTIFLETLRRSWRQILYWGIGLGLWAMLILVVIPDVDALEQYAQLAETLPPAIMQMFGTDAAALATPEGFLGYGYFFYAVLILAVFAVLSGLGITANEEDSGVLDVVLSMPLPRWRVIVEKFAAYTLIAVGIVLVSMWGIFAGMALGTFELNTGRLVESSLNLIPGVLLMMALTTMVAALVRRRALAVGIVVAFILASYFIDFLGAAASDSIMEQLAVLSFFNYLDSDAVMQNGLNAANVGLLLGASLALLAGSLFFFERRDVGV